MVLDIIYYFKLKLLFTKSVNYPRNSRRNSHNKYTFSETAELLSWNYKQNFNFIGRFGHFDPQRYLLSNLAELEGTMDTR